MKLVHISGRRDNLSVNGSLDHLRELLAQVSPLLG